MTFRISVIGHPFNRIGMGEHARSVFAALREVGAYARLVDVYGHQKEIDPAFRGLIDHVEADVSGDLNIFCLNGDEVGNSLKHLDGQGRLDISAFGPDPNWSDGHRARFTRKPREERAYNVIYPAWELEIYPEEWARQLERFDAVWAPSGFIRDSISKNVTIPVRSMPIACERPLIGMGGRSRFGLPDSAFVFLFAFDFLSYIQRKNPYAVTEAFRRFLNQRPFADARLALKVHNSDRGREAFDAFTASIAEITHHVVLIDESLTAAEMGQLIWQSDCIVSLHRSEGFGRLMTEAMTLGRPVIATDYSGNTEFCRPETCHLVQGPLIPLQEGDYPHWRGQRWADPDPEQAAAHMTAVYDDPATAQEKARKARHVIAAEFSSLAVGLRYLDEAHTVLGA